MKEPLAVKIVVKYGLLGIAACCDVVERTWKF
jgi:hypothetical protein